MTMKVVMFGCGFLASHILPHILPFCDQLILIDRERIEQVNYENGLLLKDYIGKFKTTNLAMLAKLLSNIPVAVYQDDLKGDILNLIGPNEPDTIGILTFDNPESRLLVKENFNFPIINVGVTENYFNILWLENMDDEYFTDPAIKQSMARIKDVCERKEFRSLGMLASSYAFHFFYLYLTTHRKYGCVATLDQDRLHTIRTEDE